MSKVFLIGGGSGGEQVLNSLLPFPWVEILGIADQNKDAPALKKARDARIPIFLDDPIETLKTLPVDIVFDLTGDEAMRTRLLKFPDRSFEVATGDVTRLFINILIQIKAKDNLLQKHREINRMIAESKTFFPVFDTIVARGMEITQMPVGSLSLFMKQQNEFVIMAQRGLPEGLAQKATYPIRVGGLTQYILSHDKPIAIPDLRGHPEINSALVTNAGIRSLVAIPLYSGKETLGILYFDDTEPRTYPPDILDVLSQFATEAVLAIQKQKAIADIMTLSSRDSLTDLYNRDQLGLQLGEAVLKAKQNNETLALLLCDLDKFRELNETLGHQYGDRALKITASNIKALLTPTGGADGPTSDRLHPRHPLLFRSGADEFAVILPNTTREAILQKASQIQNAIQEAGQQVSFPLSISIGVAVYPEQCQSIDQLITRANRSLLMAKKGDEKVCVGDDSALKEVYPISMVFEPIVDLDENQVIGYEALARDIYGKVTITDLFRKYVALGQLAEVKSHCFISQLKKAKEIGLARVFLNVDSILLHQCEWIQKPHDLDVVLEISESESLYDLDTYLTTTERWKKKGFKFAIDDFGAGFISLPFISRLQPEYVKVDRSVILRSVTSPTFRSFLKSLVSAMQQDHNATIIAEGIENEEELSVTEGMGIHLVQGFLLKDKGYATPAANPALSTGPTRD